MSSGVIIKRVKGKGKGNRGRNLHAAIAYIDNTSGDGKKLHCINGQSVIGSINILADKRCAQRDEILKNHARYKGRGRTFAHYILSYGKGFGHDFTALDFRVDVKTLLKHLGLAEHACMYSVHANTENLHLHIVVDRVSLEWNNHGKHYIPLSKGTVLMANKKSKKYRHDIYCQHAAMHEICVSRGYSTCGILTDMYGNPLHLSKKNTVSNASTQRELRTGKKSPERLLKEKADEILHEATSWADALAALISAGIQYKLALTKRGHPKGAVLISAENNKIQLLSSRLAHRNSYRGLSKRFGAFPNNYRYYTVPPVIDQGVKGTLRLAQSVELEENMTCDLDM